MFLQDNSGSGPKDLTEALRNLCQYTKDLRSAIFEFDSALSQLLRMCLVREPSACSRNAKNYFTNS